MWIEREKQHDLHPQYRNKENHSWNQLNIVRNKEEKGGWATGKEDTQWTLEENMSRSVEEQDQQERQGRKST